MPTTLTKNDYRATIARLNEDVKNLDTGNFEEDKIRAKQLGQRFWQDDLALWQHDLKETEDIYDIAGNTTEPLKRILLESYHNARRDPAKEALQLVVNNIHERTEFGDRIILSVDPKITWAGRSRVINAAYEAQPAFRYDLVYAPGSTVKAFEGEIPVGADALSGHAGIELLAELKRRHHGIEGVGVVDGKVSVTVGNAFDLREVKAVNKLVKRDIGNVPLVVSIDSNNEKNLPTQSAINGMIFDYLPDGSRVASLKPSQADVLLDHFANKGVTHISSWYIYGSFIHVPNETTKEEAEAILAEFCELVPSDYVVVYRGPARTDRNGYAPHGVTADQVLACTTDEHIVAGCGPARLKKFYKDADSDLPDLEDYWDSGSSD